VSTPLPLAELHLLGEGPCRTQIAETATSLGIADRVHLHGAGYDVAGFLSTLDLFVLSSIDEGLPISLMEAMAAGLPVVSTLLPGLPELAPENVVAGYAPPGQPDALADLMLRSAQRTDLAAVGETAFQWAGKFGIAETWRQYRGTFEEALEKKGRRIKGAA
jgi:glycosyltransferase involved in cell wall biosynthesis